MRELGESLKDTRSTLVAADPGLKAQLYEEPGIAVRFDPVARIASVDSRPNSAVQG